MMSNENKNKFFDVSPIEKARYLETTAANITVCLENAEGSKSIMDGRS